MKGRGRGQLPPFDQAATFFSAPASAPATIASVTYDDPNGSGDWEGWEPGPNAPKSEQELRWDEDGDTNLRHPKQLPRTLITTSELDWEDSEEVATELWLHPQRRAGREHVLPGRGARPAAPDTNRGARAGGSARQNTALRPTAGARPAAQTGQRPLAHTQRAAEPTARWRNGAPQRLPAAPPPRAAEPLPERRERTITQPGAAASQPPQQLPAAPRRPLYETQISDFGAPANEPPQQLPAAPRRPLYDAPNDDFDAVTSRPPPQQLPAAPRRALHETQTSDYQPLQLSAAPQRSLYETQTSDFVASTSQPPQQLPAAPRRSLHETQTSDFGAAQQPPAAPRRSLYETQTSDFLASNQGSQLPAAPWRPRRRDAHEPQAGQPAQQLPAAPRRSLNETQVSGFGAAPVRSHTPAPGTLPPAPAIESLRGKLESTQRILPPPRPQNTGHIPTILGTPAATGHGTVNNGPNPGRLPPPAAILAPGAASTSVQAAAIEHLQEQLLEAMARVRVQEARAAEAENSVAQVEEQLEAIVRTQMTEAEELQEQLRLTSEQLRVSEVRAVEAERRSLVMQRPSNMLHLAEPELTPRASKQGRANLVLSGLLASTLSFGGAAYFMFYAPLQKQLVALEQQRVQDAQAQANALTSLKAQANGERQGFDAQTAELRKQLEAARAEAQAASTAPEEGRRGGRSRRSSSADADAEEAPAGTRSARAIERRMRRARAAAAPDADQPAPARSSKSSRDDGNDPLGGI